MPTPPAQPSKRRRPSSPTSQPPTPMRAPKRPHPSLTKPFKSPLKRPDNPSSPSNTSGTPSKAQPNRATAHDQAALRAAQSDIAALEQALRLLSLPVPPDTHASTNASTNAPSAEEIWTRVNAAGTPIPQSDARLEARTRSWRRAAREAAETVRADMGARVKDSGGLRAWRAREREAQAWGADEDDKRRGDEEVEGLSALERAEVRRLREEVEEARADEEELRAPRGGMERDADYDGGGGGEVTMGVMLGMLHVDPALLGWLEDEQRWADELE